MVWNDESGCEHTTSHQVGLVSGRRRVKILLRLRKSNRHPKYTSINYYVTNVGCGHFILLNKNDITIVLHLGFDSSQFKSIGTLLYMKNKKYPVTILYLYLSTDVEQPYTGTYTCAYRYPISLETSITPMPQHGNPRYK